MHDPRYMPKKVCQNCGQVIHPGKGYRREYCSNKCRQAAYRRRKELANGR